MKKSARRTLGKGELRALIGKGGANLLFLTGVFFLSLFAIGGTRGVLTFLKERMDDPFVQLVGIDIPYGMTVDECNQWVFGAPCPSDVNCSPESVRRCDNWNKEFSIKDFVAVHQTARFFSVQHPPSVKAKKPTLGWVGNIDESSGLYSCVQSRPENFITDTATNPLFSADCPHGLILSKEFAKKADYNWTTGSGYLWFHMGPDEEGIPLPVAAVVANLPEDIDILASDRIFKYLKHRRQWALGGHPLHPSTRLSTTHILVEDTSVAQFQQWKSQAYKVWPSQSHFKQHVVLEMRTGSPDIPGMRAPIPENNPFFSGDLTGSPDFSFVFFDDLNRVAAYRDTLRDHPEWYTQTTNKIILDTTDVEAKQNLATFESVARTMSWALLILGVLLIMFYMGALFNNHLESNEQNLGTLQAFGFSNTAIIRLYILIGSELILLAFALSYCLLFVIGTPGVQFILRTTDVNLYEQVRFQHAPMWQLAIAFVILPALAIGLQVRKRLVGATPGDLIYKRRRS